jgi:hypothetical protein
MATIDRWFLLRFVQDEDVEVDEDQLSDALADAENAANESLSDDGVQFKLGPEIQGYTEKRS